MKNLFLLPLFAVLGFLAGFSPEKIKDRPESGLLDTGQRGKYRPPYEVMEGKPDAQLKKSEAVFDLTFDVYGMPVDSAIKMAYNDVQLTIRPDAKGTYALKVKPGKYVFQFYLDEYHLEIKTDSIAIASAQRRDMNVHFQTAVLPTICDKPVIYVYPTKTQQVDISLDLKGKLAFTYPQYNNGWSFTADPDGAIHMNGKQYHYLFWDGATNIQTAKVNWNEGFVVAKDSLVGFFEEQLTAMGLNSREIDDYITYWCPRMNVNEMNYVHFMFNAEYNEYAALNVNPKPDQLFRVFMLWTKAENEGTGLQPQRMESFKRNGFTVVEWGGAEMENLPAEVQ